MGNQIPDQLEDATQEKKYRKQSVEEPKPNPPWREVRPCESFSLNTLLLTESSFMID